MGRNKISLSKRVNPEFGPRLQSYRDGNSPPPPLSSLRPSVQIFPSGLLQMTNARNGFLALIISDPDSLLARKSLIGPAKIAERKNLGSIR